MMQLIYESNYYLQMLTLLINKRIHLKITMRQAHKLTIMTYIHKTSQSLTQKNHKRQKIYYLVVNFFCPIVFF